MHLLLAVLLLPRLLACQTFAPRPVDAVRTGVFANPGLRESSGAARSRQMPGVFYTINDSDNPPEIFAFDSTGRDLGQWRVPGTANRDWEAMAVGPCPAGSCLYLGDLGDNAERRPSAMIYRLREPSRLDMFRGAAIEALDLDSLNVRYPDGPHDAEAMWVGPGGDVFVVTKGRSRGIRLFRLDARGFGMRHPPAATLVQVVPITPEPRLGRWVTDAALAPDGRRVAIRTYTELYIFPLDPLGRLGTPAVCNLAGLEPQGEGVEWVDGTRLLLTSESGPMGHPAPIHEVRCGA